MSCQGQASKVSLGLIVCVFFLGSVSAGELDGLLKGTYGSAETMICTMPVPIAQGQYPPLPHLNQVGPSTYALLVDAKTVSRFNNGLTQFSGDGTFTLTEGSVWVDHSAVSAGDVPFPPQAPAECSGVYSVDTNRRVTAEASCVRVLHLPDNTPLTVTVGPFKYGGYLGADPRMLILNVETAEPITTEVKLPDQTVISSYEGLCASNWILTRVDRDPLQFSQFGNGGDTGFTSDLVLANPSSSAAVSGTMSFKDDDGVPMEVGIIGEEAPTSELDFTVQPLAALTVSTDGQGEQLVGSATVDSDGDLGGVVRFDIPGIGITGVGTSEVAAGLIIPVRRKTGGINTGVALINAGDSAVALEFSLRNEAGGEVASTSIEDFPAHGHTATFIDQLFDEESWDEAPLNDFRGSLVVKAPGGSVAATALELDAAAGKFTTLPVTPLQ
jgi:hypothetical protein